MYNSETMTSVLLNCECLLDFDCNVTSEECRVPIRRDGLSDSLTLIGTWYVYDEEKTRK